MKAIVPVGTLISVTDSYNTLPEINKHGKLWIVEGVHVQSKDQTLYECRALATGYVYVWYNFEIEEQPNEYTERSSDDVTSTP